MAITIDQLGDFCDRLSRTVRINSTGAVKRAAKRALASLVHTTPVDTGLARSNWFVSVGGPEGFTLPVNAPEATIAAGNAVIDAARDDQAIVLQNNLEYIEVLNQGSSRQAPAGFVETAVQEAAASLATEKVVD